MRLAFIIHSMAGGGAERVTANLANYWADKGWEIVIVTLAGRSLDFYELLPTVQRIPLDLAGSSDNILGGTIRNICRIKALRKALSEIQPDIAIGIMTTSNILLALAAGDMPTLRTIGSEHVHPPQVPLAFQWEWLRRHTYARLDATTALTAESAAWIEEHTHARRVSVIPNAAPYPLAPSAPYRDALETCRPERRVLLAVGRLEVQKGFDWLLHAFAPLSSSYPDWDLVILGEGSQRPALEAQTAALGLDHRVFLPGLVGNLGDYYSKADIYVMSSRFEGFGNTLAEALAYGVPGVSFDCMTGPSGIIRDGVDGTLVPPGDINALTVALGRLMGNEALRRCFAAKAVEARERFSLQHIAGLWEHLFSEICL